MSVEVLEAALRSGDDEEVDDAVDLAWSSPDPALAAPLAALLRAPWHRSHEDIARLLQRLRSPVAVDALLAVALDPPANTLALDDGHALSRKCTWALADIGTAEARAALQRISTASDPEVAGYARRRLERWEQELGRKGPG